MSNVSSTLDLIDDKTPWKTNNDINNYYYNKNNFTDRRIFRVPLHRSEKEKKSKEKKERLVSALRAEQWFGFHHDGGSEDQMREKKARRGPSPLLSPVLSGAVLVQRSACFHLLVPSTLPTSPRAARGQ